MLKLLAIILFFSLLVGCEPTKGKSYCGKVLYQRSVYDPVKKVYKPLPVTVVALSQDSFVIQNHSTLVEENFYLGHDSTSLKAVPSNSYLLDLRTLCFYKFSGFSDTTTLIKTFHADEVGEELVWFSFKKPEIFKDPYYPMPDTSIEGIVYKRIRITNGDPRGAYSVFYLRCDQKKNVLKLFEGSEETATCPVWGYDVLPTPSDQHVSSERVIHVADTLSPQELRIFKKWRKQVSETSCNTQRP